MLAHAVSLSLFPVKACAGLPVERLVFNEAQRIEGDREWVIVDAEGQVLWQGSHPRLALVQPSFEGPALVLRAPGLPPLQVPADRLGPAIDVGIWNDSAQRSETFAAWDAGAGARAFLQAATGAELRLVRLGEAALARSGVNPVHLLSSASLDELNQTLRSRGQAAAESQRFRPNIVIDGEAVLPFLEEHVTQLRWGDGGELRVTSPCMRCIVPNVNPASGVVEAEPAPTVAELSAQRRPGAPSTLGIYARPTRAGVLVRGALLELELSL